MQTNAVVAKKIFEPIANPLKKFVTGEPDTRIDSHLLTTNEADGYYEHDHSSEYAAVIAVVVVYSFFEKTVELCGCKDLFIVYICE